MTKLPLLSASLATIILSACATYTPPVQKDITKTETINVSYDQAWQNATEWFASNNIPIKNIAKDSGLIATDYSLRASSRDFDCGTPGQLDTVTSRTANMNIFVKKTSPQTVSVTVNVLGKAMITNMAGTQYQSFKTVDCVSAGSLEKGILDAIRGN